MKKILILASFVILLVTSSKGETFFEYCEKYKGIDTNKKDSIPHYNNLNKAQFDNIANFIKTKFNSETFVREAKFHNKAYFNFAQFHNKIHFNRAQFYSVADFEYAQFHSKSLFFNTKFLDTAKFGQAQFLNEVSFEGAKFDSLSEFNRADFHDKANLFRAQFRNKVDFSQVQFYSNCDFSGVKFSNLLDLTLSNIDGNIKFDFSTLPDTILLNRTTINGRLDFSYALPKYKGHECIINFHNTNIDNLILDYTLFKIDFQDSIVVDFNFVNNEMKLEYRGIEDRVIEKMYTDLLRVQERHNFKDGYKKLDIQYHKFKSSFVSYWIRKLWDNFGYNKELIFRNTLVLLGFCFLVIWVFFSYFILKIYCPKSLLIFRDKFGTHRKTPKGNYNVLHTLPYAAYYTLILFFGLKMDLENFKISGEFKYAKWKKRVRNCFCIFYLLFGSCLYCLSGQLYNYQIRDVIGEWFENELKK